MNRTIVIDYGTVNLKNIMRALSWVGIDALCTKDPGQIEKADRIVLPGVGAFGAAMNEIHRLGIDDAIKTVARKDRPLLGICLGMQLLMDSSMEHGVHRGLELIPGTVRSIPTNNHAIKKRKIPHIGWNSLLYASSSGNWADTCLDQTVTGAFCYFVHSFMVIPDNADNVLAKCDYMEQPIVAAIRKDNITGLQFHPELSGSVGLSILRRFFETKWKI